jgi:phage gp29-like protein
MPTDNNRAEAIRKGMLKYHEKKRKLQSAQMKAEELALEKQLAIENFRDPLKEVFNNITPAKIKAALDSTKTGYLLTWNDFCDYMLHTDSHIESCVSIRIHNISAKKLVITPSDPNDLNAIKAAEFVKKQIIKIPKFDTVLKQLLMGIFYGGAFAEVDWRIDEQTGNVYPKELFPLSMRKFKIILVQVDEFGDPIPGGDIVNPTNDGKFVYGWWNYGDNGYAGTIDQQTRNPGRLIVHSPGLEIELHEKGLFRKVAENWFYKKCGVSIFSAGVERITTPATVAKVPSKTDIGVRNHIAQGINNLFQNNSYVFDKDVEFDWVPVGQTGGDAIWKQYLTFINAEISKALLGGNLINDSAGGSNADQAIEQKNTLSKLVLSDATALAETLRDQLVRYIIEYNIEEFGGIMPPIPNVEFDLETKENKEISQTAIDAGVVTNNELRESLGLIPWNNEQGNQIVSIETETDKIAMSLFKQQENKKE